MSKTTNPRPIKPLEDYKKLVDADLISRATAVLTGLTGNTNYANPPIDLATFKSGYRHLLGVSCRECRWQQEGDRREKEAARRRGEEPEAFGPLCRGHLQRRHGDLQVQRVSPGFHGEGRTTAFADAVDQESRSRRHQWATAGSAKGGRWGQGLRPAVCGDHQCNAAGRMDRTAVA